ncbi:MAG: hypothetical protein QXL94_03055 [Candidatus Parvarchaeum sp.]
MSDKKGDMYILLDCRIMMLMRKLDKMLARNISEEEKVSRIKHLIEIVDAEVDALEKFELMR